MAQVVKRLQLTAFPCDFSSTRTDEKSTLHTNSAPSAPASVALAEGNASEVQTQSQSTVRYVLALFQSDEHVFPEFSYTELVEKNKQSGSMVIKPGAPIKSEEQGNPYNEEAAIIARQFEKKYGQLKKKKDRIQDLVDIGYGYDDEDSFIDNSEAYDELVPASLTTKHGGFYVNSGVLQFRQASDTEADDFTARSVAPGPPKKRKLSGGSDKPQWRSRDGRKRARAADAPDGVPTEGVSLETAAQEPKKMKKKKSCGGPLSVTSMLKKFRRRKERELQQWGAAGGRAFGAASFPACPADAAGGGGTALADPLLSLIGSTDDHELIRAAAAADFDIDLDSLLDATEEVSQLKTAPHATDPHPVMGSPGSADFQHQATILFQAQAELTSLGAVPRPSALPEGLSPELEGTIGDLKDPLEKLREAIGKVMPEQIARFHNNQQAHAQVKSSKGAEEKKTREQRVNVGSEDEGDEKIRKRGPQKKFKWNEEIRECLCLVVKARMDKYESGKGEGQEMEEHLKNFLDNEIKTLWPKGWMQPRLLLKESKKFLGQSSSSVSQRKVKSDKKMATINSGSNCADSSAESPDGHSPSASSPAEQARSLDTDLKTLKEVLMANAHPHVPVFTGGNGGKRLASESPAPSETAGRPPRDATPPVTAAHSPLDLLAEQALARGQLLNATLSQKLKAVAGSAATWTFSDLQSPALPSPAPQSNPVGFPGVGVCHLFEATAPQDAQVPGQEEASETQALADDGTTSHPLEERNHVAHNRTDILEEQDFGTHMQM